MLTLITLASLCMARYIHVYIVHDKFEFTCCDALVKVHWLLLLFVCVIVALSFCCVVLHVPCSFKHLME